MEHYQLLLAMREWHEMTAFSEAKSKLAEWNEHDDVTELAAAFKALQELQEATQEMSRLMRDLLTITLLREVGPEPPSREVWIERLSALGIADEASVSQMMGSVTQLCWRHEIPPPWPSQNALRRRSCRSMRKK